MSLSNQQRQRAIDRAHKIINALTYPGQSDTWDVNLSQAFLEEVAENQSLKAQVAEMREALKRMRWVSGLHQG